MGNEGKPFCVKGGECIGNVPTIVMLDRINDANSAEDYWGLAEEDLVADGGMNQLDISDVVGKNKCLCFGSMWVKHLTESGYRFQIWYPTNVEMEILSKSDGSVVWEYNVVFRTADDGTIYYRLDVGINDARLVMKCWIVFGKDL